MEYSFVHFAGVLWTSDGARKPDWTLWHADLPVHPEDPTTPVTLEAPSGSTTTVTVFDLASVLLQQQPSEASPEKRGNERVVEDGEMDGALKPRPMGSVAALTSGLRPRIDSPETDARARAALEKMLAGFDSEGWFAIDFVDAAKRPWVLRAVDPPSNFNQQPKTFASESSALRNAERLVEELRYAHAGMALRMPRKQVRLRRFGERKFTALDILLLAAATDSAPTSLVA